MINSLTPKQLQILEWIHAHLEAQHTMPSRREIAFGLGLSSPATIQQHIEALEKKGFLKRGEAGGSRALQWTARSKKLILALHSSNATGSSNVARLGHSRNSDVEYDENHSGEGTSPGVSIPLLGSIAAGYPIEVFSQSQSISVPLELLSGVKSPSQAAGRQELYALKVSGDSMIEDGILPDDIVVLKKSDQARTGDTVAALVNGEATLKRFSQKGKQGSAGSGAGSGVELHPANPKYPVIEVSGEDRFEIQGVLVALFRRY